MINYHEIWESINKESEKNLTKAQIARRIPSKGVKAIFLATDIKRGVRLLYVYIEESSSINPDILPKFKGLEISVTTTTLGPFNNQKFILFSQSIPQTENIFELIISDICDSIAGLRDTQNLPNLLVRVLNEWKIFFDKQPDEILLLIRQEGLFGELSFLRDHLMMKYSAEDAVSFWTGPENTNHDFQIHDTAVEVKTTSGKQHRKITISSERQLDSTGLNHLYLSVYALNIHANMPEASLPVLIEDIRTKMKNDQAALFCFDIKLVKSGYMRSQSSRYKTGFSIIGSKLFEVKCGFPRLISQNIPDGVGDIKYTVVLSACTPFEITQQITNIL